MTKLKNVNTRDIELAIKMGCRTMSRVFNPSDHNIPYFGAQVIPYGKARLSFCSQLSEAHVPGRHLNALLNAEDILDVQLGEACIDNHANAAFFSYSGPLCLPLNRDKIGGRLVNFLPHNVREGLHALYALYRFRDSVKAFELIRETIKTMNGLWDSGDGWNQNIITNQFHLTLTESNFIGGLARSIAPLTKIYNCSEYKPALDLAITLKDKLIDGYFPEDGSFSREVMGTHSHSVTSTMASLALLAETTHDAMLMDRVKEFYDHGLWSLRDELGWVIENEASEDSGVPKRLCNPDRGEVNSTGDIIETALILADFGYTQYYNDVERIIRSHFLPSQLLDNSFILGSENTEIDAADSLLGAFGFPAPYGHVPIGFENGISFNLDIVGGSVGSLCEVYRHICIYKNNTHFVNLLFDYHDENIEIRSPYPTGRLSIKTKKTGKLMIRIPDFARDTYEVLNEKNYIKVQDYLYFDKDVNHEIHIMIPLKESIQILKHRKRTICAKLIGDEVVAMENHGAILTYFSPL